MKRRSFGLAALALAGCVVGCGSSSTWSSSYEYDYRRDDPWAWSRSTYEPQRDAPPDLGLTDAEVEAGLAATPLPADVAPDGADQRPIEVAAAEVDACYRAGERERARALVAAHPRLVDWTDRSVVVSCRFVGSGEGIELTAIRTDSSLGAPREALAVCFEPGTYGAPVVEAGSETGPTGLEPTVELGGEGWNPPDSERRYRHWPVPQDLALLRAPVLVIPRGEAIASVCVPVACASFQRGAPDAGTPYALARFEAGSSIDRLMVVLCQGDEVANDAEAQLAVWLARDDVSWTDFVAQGGDRGRLVTFGSASSVRAHHAGEAARLLLRAGVDPRPRRFFNPTGGEQTIDNAPDPTPAPTVAPEPPLVQPVEPVDPAKDLS